MSATTTRPAPVTGQVPRPASSRVRVPQLAVGLLLTAGAALTFLLWNATSVARTAVVALAVDVERGQVVTGDDLRTVFVGTDDALDVTAEDDTSTLVGRKAAIDLPAGTLVTTAQLTTAPTLTPGAGVVGLALAPGEYPLPDLSVGDLVDVLDVGPDGSPTVLVERAQVVSAEPLGSQGQRFVSIQTGEDLAAAVADVAALGDVRLVLVTDTADGEETAS